MTHKNTTLAITAIVVAVAMTAAALAIPHQALAAGHNHNHNHGGSSIGVSQNSTQLNAGCSNGATCVNSVSIHR
jgi:hypothetical protein